MKFLAKQPKPQQERLLRAIYKLPGEGDIKAMAGHDDLYRLRVGSYRVLYTIENAILTVRVLQIGNRGDIYK
ncbi:MAG: type II toxin-antitoxin system RelE/ParE family toxin [Clostridia bacterium]|nr:type II toxin-antitoxin system RelE/ParE family toxin [Clostridia bacterium]